MINDYINAWAKLIKESEDDDAVKQAIADSFDSECEDIMKDAVSEYCQTKNGKAKRYQDELVQFALDDYWEDLRDEAIYDDEIKTAEDFSNWICEYRLDGIDDDYIAKNEYDFDEDNEFTRNYHDDDYDEDYEYPEDDDEYFDPEDY